MEYVLIGLIITLVVAASTMIYLKVRPAPSGLSATVVQAEPRSSETESINEENDERELAISVEMLPAEIIQDESRLVEITDKKVLARVNSLIPVFAQVGNATNTAMQSAQASSEVLYKAIIPVGEKLAKSRDMDNAVRGFYHGRNGIKGHANLVAVKAQNSTTVVANTAAAAMGVAAMVVGQYYMAQINSDLGKISNGISQISDFQNKEYQSRVLSLIAHIKMIADFQEEILENNELRADKVKQLDQLVGECTQLLGQATLTLEEFTKHNTLDFKSYEHELQNAQTWYLYQNSLLDVLYKASDLKYTLSLGAISRAHCARLFSIYQKNAAETQKRLTCWHVETTTRLNIDTSESRRKRDGFDGKIHSLLGFFNSDWNFRPIEEDTANTIKFQAEGYISGYKQDTSDLYSDDVQLFLKDGKIFYLPAEN